MLPFNPVTTTSGCQLVAAFVQGGQPTAPQQQRSRAGAPGSLARRPSAATAACGLLVMASACCPPRPRSGRLQTCASRSKTRRRRSGSSGGGDDGDSFSDFGGSWPLDDWSSLYGGSDGGDDNNNNGNGGSGGWHHSWDSAGGDAFHQFAVYHATWLWQVLCGASLLRSLYFLLFSDAQVDAVAVGGSHLQHVAMAC